MARLRHYARCIVVLATVLGLANAQTRFCLKLERKDVQQIWWATEQSLFCNDVDIFAAEGSKGAEDLGFNIKNGTVSLVVDGGYTNFDDEFMTNFEQNLTMSVYSKKTRENLYLTFNTSMTNYTDPMYGKMFYNDNDTASNNARRWILYIGKKDLQLEGLNNDVKLSVCIILGLYMFFMLHEVYPEWIAMDGLLEVASLSVFLRIPIQTYVFSFGYATGFLAIMGLSAFLSYFFTRKLPKWFYVKYSMVAAVILFYSMTQYKYSYLTILLVLVPIALVGYFTAQIDAHQTEVFRDKLVFLFLLGFLGANFVENAYTIYYKIKFNELDYVSNWRYFYHMSTYSALSAALVALFGSVGQLAHARIEMKRAYLRNITKHNYVLVDADGHSDPVSLDFHQDANGTNGMAISKL